MTYELSRPRPIDVVLARTSAELLADGVITRDEVERLAKFAKTSTGDAQATGEHLRTFVEAHAARFESRGALEDARRLLGAHGAPRPRPKNELYEVRGAPGENNLRAQELYLHGEGRLGAHTGIRTYSRGWLQLNRGVLADEHGSRPPASAIATPEETRAMTRRSPAERLDRIAELLRGGRVGMSSFSELARSKAFANPDEANFAGVCYAWAWAALDSRLSELVDVEGPPSKRGLWVAGEWLSRADLGNWLMALLAGLSQGAGDVMWFNPEAEDLLKAALGYLVEGGTGFRADIGPLLENPSEIWFQPFVGADIEVLNISELARRGVLDVARAPTKTSYGAVIPGVEGADVKLLRVTGQYGDEVADDHEGDPRLAEVSWAAYAVLDAEGKMLRAYLASDPRVRDLPGLPARDSKPVPRELFAPDHALVDGILLGTPPPEVEGSVFGPHLELFVGTVLARGVPGALRAAFEAEPALRRPAKLDAETIDALADRYPTIANAYTTEQWARAFGARGLDRARFGGA